MMIQPRHRGIVWSALGGYMLALLAGALVLARLHAYQAGFSGADESAHFLNGYFVSNYLHGHAGDNPLAYATEYYLHYPKISIGHWPPAYYGMLGVLLLALPATPQAAFLINLLVAALPAAALGWMLAWLAGRRLALAGCVVYVLTPLAVEGQAFFMLDQALTACCAGAVIAWLAYMRRPGWSRAGMFAALCACAVLIKGNGWLVVLMPLFHMLLTRCWRLLALPYLYLAGLAAATIIVPWHWLTSSIAADGFNYQPGLPYAWQALTANLLTLLRNLGHAGAPLALFAIVMEYRRRLAAPRRWHLVAAAISLILATLSLQSLVPADIDARYLAPALPAYTALAVLGALHVGAALSALLASATMGALNAGAMEGASHTDAKVGASHAGATGGASRTSAKVGASETGVRVGAVHTAATACDWTARLVIATLFVVMLAPGIAHLAQRGPKVDLRAADLPVVPTQQAPAVWIIDGSSGAEGALIAELAVRDPGLRHYAVRASKLLAATDFMGRRYALKFADAQQVLDELQRLGASYVVLVRLDHAPAFPHSAQLAAALRLPRAPFRRVLTLPHRHRAGVTEVYAFDGAAKANIGAVRRLGVPAKAGALASATLH